MTIINEKTCSTGNIIAYDFDAEGRIATILQTSSRQNCLIQLADQETEIPDRWQSYVNRIKWIGAQEALIWPIGLPKDLSSYVGRVGPFGAELFNIGYPLDILTSGDLIASTYAESWIFTPNDPSPQSDLISVYRYNSARTLDKLLRLRDPFLRSYSNVPLLEVEQAALDYDTSSIWFTADKTDSLWRLSVESAQILTGPLMSNKAGIIGIACKGDTARLISFQSGSVFVRGYTVTDNYIKQSSEERLDPDHWLARRVKDRKIRDIKSCIGYGGNRVGLLIDNTLTLGRI